MYGPRILVLGSTGTVGSAVVRLLRGQRVRAGYRNRVPEGEGVEPARVDLATGEGVDEAVRGVERVFLLAGSIEDQPGAEARVVDACVRAGVRRIVKLSVLAAETEAYSYARIHRAGEKAVEASGIPWTFLRPGSFMQNFAGFFAESINGASSIFLPCAGARDAHIDARDIAAVGAAALTEDGHEGRAYDLVGPEALTYAQCAAVLSGVIGRTITYVDIPDEEYRRTLVTAGVPDEEIERLSDLWRFIREERFPLQSDAVKRVTGREPISFARFARDYAGAWR